MKSQARRIRGSSAAMRCVEMRLMRRLTDHQDGPPQFLQEKVSGLDRRATRPRALPVRPDRRIEAAVLALMLKRHLNAVPCRIRRSHVTRDDGCDHAAATAPLRTGFKPTPIGPVASGETLGIRLVVGAKRRQPPRGK